MLDGPDIGIRSADTQSITVAATEMLTTLAQTILGSVWPITFSSDKGMLLKSSSVACSSTGNCCTTLLTASKRRLLLMAVL